MITAVYAGHRAHDLKYELSKIVYIHIHMEIWTHLLQFEKLI